MGSSSGHICPRWLNRGYVRTQRDTAVRDAVKALKDKNFDTIAVSGVSGLLLGPILAYKLKKELIVVRKNQGAHSSHITEGYDRSKRYIIVDDVVSSGATLHRIIEAVSKLTRTYEYGKNGQESRFESSVLEGVYFYGHDSTEWCGWFPPDSTVRKFFDDIVHQNMIQGKG